MHAVSIHPDQGKSCSCLTPFLPLPGVKAPKVSNTSLTMALRTLQLKQGYPVQEPVQVMGGKVYCGFRCQFGHGVRLRGKAVFCPLVG